MSLPTLPDGWVWAAKVDADSLTVQLIRVEGGYCLAKRTIRNSTLKDILVTNPDSWERYIAALAETIWADYNEAAKLSAKLGIQVLYE